MTEPKKGRHVRCLPFSLEVIWISASLVRHQCRPYDFEMISGKTGPHASYRYRPSATGNYPLGSTVEPFARH